MDELTARDFGGRNIGPRDLTTPLAAGPRWDTVQHLYTVDSMKPPPDNYLLVGEIAVSLADPMVLWVGVPTSLSANGYRQLTPAEAPSDGRVYGRQGSPPQWVPVAPAIGGGYVAKSGDTMTGPLVLPGNATLALQAVPLQQVQSLLGTIDLTAYLLKAGGTMTGFLTLNAPPTATLHAATKGYVDTNFAPIAGGGYVQKSGDTMTGALTVKDTLFVGGASYPRWRITNSAAPADQKIVDGFVDQSGNFYLQFDNDTALAGSQFLLATRSGYAPLSVTLTAPTINLTASSATNVSGYMSVVGQLRGWNDAVIDGFVYPSYTATGGALAIYGNASYCFIRFSTDNWRFLYERGTGTINFQNNAGTTLWQCTGGGAGYFSSSLTTGYVHSTGAALTDGLHTFGGGISFNTFYGHTLEFGWDGSLVRVSVDRGGVIYQIPSKGDVDNRATWDWVSGNFKNIGAYTPDQNVNYNVSPLWDTPNVANLNVRGGLGLLFTGVYNSQVWFAFGWDGHLHIAINGGGQGQLAYVADLGAKPSWGVSWNFWDLTVGGTLWAQNGQAQFNSINTNYIHIGGSGIDCAQTIQCTDGWGFRSTWLSGDAFSVWWNGSVGVIRYNRSWDLSLQAFMGSDIRMKQDIGPSSFDCLAAIRKVALYEFRWRDMTRMYDGFKPREGRGPMERVGFVAQWLREVVPEFVYVPPPNPDAPDEKVVALWEINATAMLGALCGAMQELAARIEAIERLIT